MSLSIRPTRPFGHSDLPAPAPPAPAASPRLRGQLARRARTGPECTDVLEDRKRRPDAARNRIVGRRHRGDLGRRLDRLQRPGPAVA